MFGYRISEWIIGLTLLTGGSLVGLLAIWVALGRPHWFLRTAVWAGVVLPLLWIPAFEPVLLFSIQTLVAVVPLTIARKWLAARRATGGDGERPPQAVAWWWPRFHLRDLLLLTVIVAVAAAVVAAAPADMWKFWDTVREFFYPGDLILNGKRTHTEGWALFGWLGLDMGLSALAAAWIGLGRRWWGLRLAGLLLVPTAALMAAWLVLLRATGWLSGYRSTSARPAGRHVARAVLGLLTLAIVALPVGTFVLLLTPVPQPPKVVLPEPNAYDDLCRAGEALSRVSVPETETATRDEYVAFRDAYDDGVASARAALDRLCAVPLQYTMADIENFDRLQHTRQLVRAFSAEGGLARMEERPGEAAAYYLDEIRLGRAVGRDSLAIDWVVGIAFEGIGIEDLRNLREELDAAHCRRIMDVLRRINADREPPDDVADRDVLWMRVAYGNDGWASRWLATLVLLEPDNRPMYRRMDKRHQAMHRMLLCALALRIYRLEQGELPAALGHLVPEYLPEVPLDPFGGRLLVYRPADGEYVLYSVGPDEVDNGGNAGDPNMDSWTTPGTDILLDPPPPPAGQIGPITPDE